MSAPSTMTVSEAAESRRSVRKYVQEDVPEEDLREILRQVSLAPSPDNIQPWRFVVVRDPAVRPLLAAAALNQRQVHSAHAVFVLYADMEDVIGAIDEIISPGFSPEQAAKLKARLLKSFLAQSQEERQQFAHGISYIALGFLLLAAEAMGYKTSPLLGFEPDQVKALLGLPSRVTIPALIAIGKGDEPGFPHHRHTVDRIARFV